MAKLRRGNTLTPTEIGDIKDRILAGESSKKIANDYHIEVGNVSKIRRILIESGFLPPSNKMQANAQEKKGEAPIASLTPVIIITGPEPVQKSAPEPEAIKQDTVKKTRNKQKHHNFLSDEQKADVAQYISDKLKLDGDPVDGAKVIQKFDISINTIKRIAESYGLKCRFTWDGKPVKKSTVSYSAPIQQSQVSADAPETSIVTNEPVAENGALFNPISTKLMPLRIALCSKRHEFPGTEDSIFQEMIGAENLFNFAAMKQECMEWLEKNITRDSDGKCTTNLEVYCTGFGPAITTVVQCCNEMEVNLTFLHYNNETKQYLPQKLTCFNETKKIDNPVFKYFSNDARSSALYIGARTDLFTLEDDFYIVRKSVYGSAYAQRPDSFETIICATLDEALSINTYLLKEMLSSTSSTVYSLNVRSCHKTETTVSVDSKYIINSDFRRATSKNRH